MKTRLLAATAATVLLTSAFAGTASAGAATPDQQSFFRGGGYVLQGADQVTMTFAMPNVYCGASNKQSVRIGIFGPDFDAVAGTSCFHGQVESDIEIDTAHGGRGEGGSDIALPGHIMVATVSGLNTSRPSIAIRDTNSGGSPISDHLDAASAVSAVGALGDPLARFSPFTPFVVHTTVNSGRPFTSVPHPRHNEDRHLVTKIKTGAPSDDGTQFSLYYRHH